MGRLPQGNDPGCTAGFAHGMVTAVAPDIDPTRAGEAARLCGGARTRYQEYSCIHGFGHAFMRIYGDEIEPALKLCRALGERAAADCAQGAYHDYWFAVAGADDATPARRRRARPARALRRGARAVRAAMLVPRVDRESPGDVRGRGARGPRRALLRADRAPAGGVHHRPPRSSGRSIRPTSCACARGSPRHPMRRAACAGRRCRTCATAQGVSSSRSSSGCARFACRVARRLLPLAGQGGRRAHRWPVRRRGCPRLRGAAARRACAAGAATMDEALETFS